jgi:hypothetical protein
MMSKRVKTLSDRPPGYEVPTGDRLSDAARVNQRKPSYSPRLLESFLGNQTDNMNAEFASYLERRRTERKV